MTAQSQWLSSEYGPVAAVWYEPQSPFGTVSLVVPSIGHEANLMQDGITALARSLAAEGTAVLVLQPWGADQSAGSLADDDLVGRWRAAVRCGLDAAASTGAATLQVVAARLGALMLGDELLAASDRHPSCAIDSVVLWSPTTSGHRYTRALRVLHAAAEVGPRRPESAPDNGDSDGTDRPVRTINVGGFDYPEQMLADVARSGLEVSQLAGVAAVLVVHHDRRPCPAPLLQQLAETTELTTVESADIGPWADGETEDSPQPTVSMAVIVDWMVARQDRHASAQGRVSEGEVRGRPDGLDEEFVHVSASVHGVYAPGDGTPQAALLLLSTIGPGRSFLRMAREQSALGRPVLRFDFTGSRWSGRHEDGSAAFAYDRRGVADVVEAVNWLRARGHQSVVAVGFCAGGRVLVGAAPMAALLALLVINVELFEPLRRRQPQPRWLDTHRVGRVLLRASSWWSGRHGSVASLQRVHEATDRAVFVFDDADQGARFLRSFRRGRAIAAGSLPNVDVRTRSGLGHNLEGPAAATITADVHELLAGADRSLARAERR